MLIRAAVGDDAVQSPIAAAALRDAESIAVALPALCEFVWVLARWYKRDAKDIAASIRRLIESDTVRVDRPAVEAGLALLETGGDFADGIIAFEGARLGGAVFASFDADAVRRLTAGGKNALLLTTS